MLDLRFPTRDIDPQQLGQELAAAGVMPSNFERTATEIVLLYDATTPDLATVEAVLAAHETQESKDLDQLVAKARRVWNGEDTFTQAQAQKILAGLVLLENRRR